MPRISPRLTARENAAFLQSLQQSGNVTAAAAAVGRGLTTMKARRARDPAFATEWRAALVVAQARLNGALGRGSRYTRPEAAPGAHRTKGGELIIARGIGGRLQQRAAHPGRLTSQAEQAFLLALSVTANVELSAAAAGAPSLAFQRRRRKDHAFAREWRLALAEGYARLELRCMAAADPERHEHDAWRYNEPPEPPPATVNQMLQLMYLHQKQARLLAEPAHLKRRRGESREAHGVRLCAVHEAELERAREQFRVAEAVREANGKETTFIWEQIVLPDLAQVQAGRAESATEPHDPSRALFGGWRIKDLRRKPAAEEAEDEG